MSIITSTYILIGLKSFPCHKPITGVAMLLHELEVANFIVYLKVCKKMSYYFIILPTILLGLLAHSSEVIVDIVPSVDSPCTTSCLTLSDFAAHHSSRKGYH